jgi:hypothetical protein
MISRKSYTLAGFEPVPSDFKGGSDVHCATLDIKKSSCFYFQESWRASRVAAGDPAEFVGGRADQLARRRVRRSQVGTTIGQGDQIVKIAAILEKFLLLIF